MSLRDQIANADDLYAESVHVPEWDVTIEMRTPTLAERSTMVRRFVKDDGSAAIDNLGEMFPALLVATCFDPETGEALFSESDFDLIRSKNGAIVERLAQIALRLAGLSGDAVPLRSENSSSTENGSTSTD
jgi:hypothetical protein